MAQHLKSVNIPEMDQQHQDLFSAVMALKESSNFAEDLSRAVDAVEAHFGAEEALFEKYQIPNVITHRSEHMKFLASLRKKQAELSQTSDGLVGPAELDQLVQTTTKWLKIHANAYDAPQYGTFFKDGQYIGKEW